MFHHMGIAINLAVGGIDGSFEPSCVIDGITLHRSAMGTIFVIARANRNFH